MQRPTFRYTSAAILVAAALPTSGAFAQQSASCQRLLTMVEEAGENVREDFSDARTVGETDDSDACSLYVARVVSVGGLMDTSTTDATAQSATDATAQSATDATAQSETSETTETVKVESQATIEGEVQVTLPDPVVQVEQDPADVSVRTSPPEVNVSQGQPTITIRQAQPIITVQMTQPTITVEQPAPEIVVTMPEPGVDVATAQPVVEVNIPEPRVTVTQGQPQLSVDLDANVGESAESATDTALQRTDDGGVMTVTADGLSGGAVEPRIEYVQSEEAPVVNVSGAEPQVDYVAAEADVRVESSGEPIVEMIAGGEPKIMIRNAAEADAAEADVAVPDGAEPEPEAVAAISPTGTDAATTPPVVDDQRDPREAFAAAEGDTIGDGASGVMMVGDLAGMDVRNGRGEELGEVSRIVRNGNDTYMVIEHGGWFLGLNGKEVALPIADVTVRENEVILRGLTEDQIKAMPDYDYGNEVALESDDEVTLQRVN